jgi:alpha-D-xyloside xylohydrolase
MKQTNYQLYDFLDVDPGQENQAYLWRACKPEKIESHDGDILLTIPFQKQIPGNEIKPDSTPLLIKRLIIRACGSSVLRVSLGWQGKIQETSPMLQFHASVQKLALHFTETSDQWIISDEKGQKRVEILFDEIKTDHWSDLVPAPEQTVRIIFYPDGKKAVKLTDWDMFSPTRHDAFALAAVCDNDNSSRSLTFSLKAQSDESFYGTGERFGKIDLSGKTLQLYNQDAQGVNNRRAYKNIPFYLSSENYGMFLHTSYFSKFSMADHSTRSVQVMTEDSVLDFFLIGGDSPAEILYGYRCITGFPELPPLWSFGVWMSRMTYFSEDEVKDICNRLREEQYPCDVIHLDTGWFETDWLCEWKFNQERFPDPACFIADLKAKGYRVSLWQLPYISYQAEQYEEANANNYISQSERKITSGSNFSVQDYAGTIDFTYPPAVEWYKHLLRNLLEMGVTCIKTDFGEDIHLDAEYHAMTPAQLHNLYPLLYQQAAYEVTKEVTGEGIIWARAGWAGCQRYPLHWGGDAACSWDGMAGSLRGGLQLGLSGFAFWSHDVPGFHGVPDFMNAIIPDDLYVRWTQFAVFSSHIRYHGTSKREPWHFPAISQIIKKYWNLRYRIIPYIMEQSVKSTENGMPLLRALILHHLNDPVCRHIDNQYYFGDAMMVAPVMNSAGVRDIYLPEGQWVHYFNKQQFEGGRWLLNQQIPIDEIPVFVKAGAGIPVYPEAVNCTDEMDMSRVINEKYL